MATFTVETGMMVPMRDGVRLATDIYRPADGAGADATDPYPLRQGRGRRVQRRP